MLEYNVRFGDPECQVVVPLVDSDLAELLAQAAAGALTSSPKFSSDAMVSVVLAAEHYPLLPRTGDVIEGLDEARAIEGVTICCAGVSAGAHGRLLTAGGRVLSVCGRGPTIAIARERAYQGVSAISWPGMHFRTDIAASAAT